MKPTKFINDFVKNIFFIFIVVDLIPHYFLKLVLKDDFFRIAIYPFIIYFRFNFKSYKYLETG